MGGGGGKWGRGGRVSGGGEDVLEDEFDGDEDGDKDVEFDR